MKSIFYILFLSSALFANADESLPSAGVKTCTITKTAADQKQESTFTFEINDPNKISHEAKYTAGNRVINGQAVWIAPYDLTAIKDNIKGSLDEIVSMKIIKNFPKASELYNNWETFNKLDLSVMNFTFIVQEDARALYLELTDKSDSKAVYSFYIENGITTYVCSESATFSTENSEETAN